jgi:hypothetical protein
MRPKIEKALAHLQNANYAGYFEEMNDVVPVSMMTVFQEHKGIFIAGKAPFNFHQILEIFAKEVNRTLEKPTQNDKKIDLMSIYKFLNSKYNDENLNLFCQFHYEKVYDNFTTGQAKNARISALLDYAKRNDLLEKLNSEMRGFLD